MQQHASVCLPYISIQPYAHANLLAPVSLAMKLMSCNCTGEDCAARTAIWHGMTGGVLSCIQPAFSKCNLNLLSYLAVLIQIWHNT